MSFLVARSLLAAGKMEFGETILTVVEPPSDYIDDDDDDGGAGSETASNIVRVSSIPRSMSLQMLKTFLESEKIGAGPVYDIQYNDGDDSAIVCFQHASGRPNSRVFAINTGKEHNIIIYEKIIYNLSFLSVITLL